jgi:hypothetical protein
MGRWGFPAILLFAMVQVGCATIVSGVDQKISVDSVPPGALVSIDGQPKGQTPLVTKVKRNHRHEVRVHLDGYEDASRVTYQGNNNMVFGNVLIGGLIGLAIDYASGAAYSVDPNRIFLTLTEAQGGGGDAKPDADVPASEPVERPEDQTPE